MAAALQEALSTPMTLTASPWSSSPSTCVAPPRAPPLGLTIATEVVPRLQAPLPGARGPQQGALEARLAHRELSGTEEHRSSVMPAITA